MKGVLFGLVFVAGGAADPRIFYSKSFPGSHPAFLEIVLERDGKAVYKEAPDDDQPIRFQLKKTEADEIFVLAEKLERFKRPLESGMSLQSLRAVLTGEVGPPPAPVGVLVWGTPDRGCPISDILQLLGHHAKSDIILSEAQDRYAG